jgi:hypothetical protein
MDERELAGLLHRADWTRPSLTGSVRGAAASVLSMFGLESAVSSPPPFVSSVLDGDLALDLAPGERFRLKSADGRWAGGCDGARVWQSIADLPAAGKLGFRARPQPPVEPLLAPSWLLTGHTLTVREPTTVGGRAGVQFSAVPVAGDRRRGLVGPGELSPALRWPEHEGYERVVAVVDATLGFLLCCEFQFGDRDPAVINFVSLTVGAEADPAVFAAPPGSIFGDGEAAGSFADGVFGQSGLEAARAVAGLAAGGLGAALKHLPGRRVDPFERATTEATDQDRVMPADEPLPGWATDGAGPGGTVSGSGGTPVGDDLLHLLYRGGVGMAPFTATLHQWSDGSAMLAAVPPSARQAGFGGVGFLIDAVRNQPDLADSMTVHTVYELRAGGRTAYRIDRVSPGSGTRTGRDRLTSWVTIAGDGSRCWQVYQDRVEVGAATSLPEPAAELVDGSWLLRCRLDGGEEVVVDGRPGYRVIATARPGTAPAGGLGWGSGAWLPAVAVVDAATGRLLRLTRYLGGQPAGRAEFRSVADGGPDDFGFTPPEGLRVVDRSERRAFGDTGVGSGAGSASGAGSVKGQVDATIAAARGFLGSLFLDGGQDKRG